MALQKGLQLAAVFFGKQRASGEEHPAARLERAPQGIEQIGLLGGRALGILRPAQPFDVGMAAGNA